MTIPANQKKPSVLMIAPALFPACYNLKSFVNVNLALTMKEAGWHVDIITENRPE